MFTQQECLNADGSHRATRLCSSQLASRAWQILMTPLRKEEGRQAPLPQKSRPPVYSLCQRFLIIILGTPSAAGFHFNKLDWAYSLHGWKGKFNLQPSEREHWLPVCWDSQRNHYKDLGLHFDLWNEAKYSAKYEWTA